MKSNKIMLLGALCFALLVSFAIGITMPSQLVTSNYSMLEDTNITIGYASLFGATNYTINSVSTVSNWVINQNNTLKTLYIRPSSNYNGVKVLTLNVTNSSLSMKYNITLQVNATNDAPVLNTISPQTLVEGVLSTATVSGTDVDNNTLTYSVSPSVGSLNTSSGVLRWTPSADEIGVNTLNFSVSDGITSASRKVNFTVLDDIQIKDVSVTINGVKTTLTDGKVINVTPSSPVVLNFTVKNNYNAKVENVKVNLSFGDDVVVMPLFNLNSGSESKKSFSFTSPSDLSGSNVLGIRVNSVDIVADADRSTSFDFTINQNPSRHDITLSAFDNNGNSNYKCYRAVYEGIKVSNNGLRDETINVSYKSSLFRGSQIVNVASGDFEVVGISKDLINASAGTYIVNVTATYNNGESSASMVRYNFTISNCAMPSVSMSEDFANQTKVSLWSYLMHNPSWNSTSVNANRFVQITDLNQSNSNLISCSINSSLSLNCAAPTANAFGVNKLSFRIFYIHIDGEMEIIDYQKRASINVTVTNTNDKPFFNAVLPKITLAEDNTTRFNLAPYVNDTDTNKTSLIYSARSSSNISITFVNRSIAVITPIANWNGVERVTFYVNDSTTKVANTTLINVTAVDDDTPLINLKSPSWTNVYMPEDLNATQRFSVSAVDPDGTAVRYQWYKNSTAIFGANLSYYDFLAQGVPKSYKMMVVVTDLSGKNTNTTWNLNLVQVPRASTFNGATNIQNFASSQLRNATGVVLEKSSTGKIEFKAPLNLNTVTDLDNYVKMSTGFISVDTNTYPQLNVPAKLTMPGLTSFTKKPLIYKNGALCPSTVCKYVSWSNNQLVFNVTGFSNYTAVANGTNSAPRFMSSIPTSTLSLGYTYMYLLNASDIDGDALTFNLTSAPSGMLLMGIHATNGTTSISFTTVAWQPTSVGRYNFTVKVKDTSGASASQTGYITVVTTPVATPTPVSTNNKLEIDNVDVVINHADGTTSKDSSVSEGDGISKPANPSDSVTFDVDVNNLFASSTNIEMSGVKVKVTIENIDGSKDIYETSSKIKIGDDSKKSVSLTLDIPDDVDEDTYDVVISAEGTGNNTVYTDSWTVQLEVERPDDKVNIDSASLSNSYLGCVKATYLTVDLQNIGNDQQSVALNVNEPSLGISITDSIELGAFDDDDNSATQLYSITLKNGAKTGSYPLNVVATYSGKTVTKTVTLNVADCVNGGTSSGSSSSGSSSTGSQTSANGDVSVVYGSGASNIPIVSGSASASSRSDSLLFGGSDDWTLIILLAVVVIVLMLFIAVVAMPKRR